MTTRSIFPVATVIALLLALVPRMATGAEQGRGPKAQFEATAINFGRVLPTEMRRHDFVVTNNGDAPLVIESVNPSCGCTTAGDWDREIAPGKTGKISIAFNPSNFSGAVTKSVTVVTNEPSAATHFLELKAEVLRPFLVQPAFANFLPVEGEPAKETKVIRIVNNGEAAAALQPPQVSDARFEAELRTVLAGKEFELHVTYDSNQGTGSPSATITVGTSNPDQPTLTVTAFAMPQPAVVVIPATLQLPPSAANQGYTHNIVIRNNGRTALAVTDAAATGQGISVTITEAQRGKTFYVNVTIPRNFSAPADGSAEVSVKTSHPKYPVIRVPIVPTQAAAPMSRASVAG